MQVAVLLCVLFFNRALHTDIFLQTDSQATFFLLTKNLKGCPNSPCKKFCFLVADCSNVNGSGIRSRKILKPGTDFEKRDPARSQVRNRDARKASIHLDRTTGSDSEWNFRLMVKGAQSGPSGVGARLHGRACVLNWQFFNRSCLEPGWGSRC